ELAAEEAVPRIQIRLPIRAQPEADVRVIGRALLGTHPGRPAHARAQLAVELPEDRDVLRVVTARERLVERIRKVRIGRIEELTEAQVAPVLAELQAVGSDEPGDLADGFRWRRSEPHFERAGAPVPVGPEEIVVRERRPELGIAPVR